MELISKHAHVIITIALVAYKLRYGMSAEQCGL